MPAGRENPGIVLLRFIFRVARPPIPTLPTPSERAPANVARRTPGSRGLVLSTIKYLMQTEVHTYAFSVAANAILSFFPFVVLMMTLIRRVLHSRAMYEVVLQLLRDALPAGQEFVIRHLNSMVNSRQRVQLVSVVILLITSSGIFLPLEVALNSIWRFGKNRSFLGNQLVSFGLAFACGACVAFGRDLCRSGGIDRFWGINWCRLGWRSRAGHWRCFRSGSLQVRWHFWNGCCASMEPGLCGLSDLWS